MISSLALSTLLAIGVPTSSDGPAASAKAQPDKAPSTKATKKAPKKRAAAAKKAAANSKRARNKAATASKGGAQPTTKAIVNRVQRFYDRMEDFEAKFIQTYWRRALSKSIESSGKLTIKKGRKGPLAVRAPRGEAVRRRRRHAVDL